MPTRRQMVAALGLALPTAACGADPTPDDAVEMILKKTGAPALAGAVIGRDGLIHVEAEGLRRNNGPDRVTVDDQWHLGSNTKAMTAALYGRLVEAGTAHWDAPLPTLFPDVKLDAAWSRTTIDQVMGHRAGLKDDKLLTPAWLNGSRADARPLEVQRAELVARALASPPDGKPGEFAYANANYILAGAAIERLTGGSWEAAMQREVFTPLKMTSAGFGPPRGANPWGHQELPLIGGLLGPTPVDPASPGADNPQALGPAGTVHASLADYGKFLRLFLTEGDGFLKPETIARLVRPVGVGDQPYGLGWGLVSARPWTHGTALAHEGSNTLWHVIAMVAPARGAAIVAVCNLGPQVAREATLSMARKLQRRFVA